MTIATEQYFADSRPSRFTLEGVGHFCVAMMFLSSFFVVWEPAVSDLLFFAAVPCFLFSGIRLSPAVGLLFAGLIIYNVCGLASYIQLNGDSMPLGEDKDKTGTWVFTSFYMSMSAVFLAAYIAEDPERRFQFIMKYFYWAATIASALGLIGYFHLTSFAKLLLLYDRIVSTFKDPNVFSTYLILPAVSMFISLVTGRMPLSILNVGRMGVIAAALFLAFSRGAWSDFVMASGLALILSFFLSPSMRQRNSILLKLALALVAMALLLTVLLSIPTIRDLFLDRFTLVKEYDAGEMGRFGNQKNSIPMLLMRPLGFGPLQFTNYFRENPHNTFINSFVTFGWVGGCSYLTLVVMYLAGGIKASMTRTSFQASAIVAGACLTSILAQGFQIDTEHWRHLYYLIGITWGFFAGSLERDHRSEPQEAYLAGWRGLIK